MSRYLKGRSYALRAPLVQCLLAFCLGVIGALFHYQVAFSLLIGGLIGAAANTWLALVVFRPALGQGQHKMLLAFYWGQIGKLLISLVLLALAWYYFAWLKEPANAALTLLAYVLTQLAAWLIAYQQRSH